MTRTEAKAKAKEIWGSNADVKFERLTRLYFVGYYHLVVSVRAGIEVKNFFKIGRGKSYEEALNDAKSK